MRNVVILVLILMCSWLGYELYGAKKALRSANQQVELLKVERDQAKEQIDHWQKVSQGYSDLADGYTAVFAWMVENPGATVSSLPAEVKMKLEHPELFRRR